MKSNSKLLKLLSGCALFMFSVHVSLAQQINVKGTFTSVDGSIATGIVSEMESSQSSSQLSLSNPEVTIPLISDGDSEALPEVGDDFVAVAILLGNGKIHIIEVSVHAVNGGGIKRWRPTK